MGSLGESETAQLLIDANTNLRTKIGDLVNSIDIVLFKALGKYQDDDKSRSTKLEHQNRFLA